MSTLTAGVPNEDLSFDFITHLGRKLGLTRERTTHLLGEWLVHCEPGRIDYATRIASS